MEVHVTGWRYGVQSIRLVHLLHDDFEMSMAAGKALLDLILDRSDFGGAGESEAPGTDHVRLTEPVTVKVPPASDASEAREKLENLGLTIGPSGSPTRFRDPER